MFDLFRFIVLRPAAPVSNRDRIVLDGTSPFQQALRSAATTKQPRSELVHVARAHLDGNQFVKDPSTLEHGPALDELARRLDDLRPGARRDAASAFTSAFKKAQELAGGHTFRADAQRLKDSLLATKLAGRTNGAATGALARNVRLVSLIDRVAQDEALLADVSAIVAARGASIELPAFVSAALVPPPTVSSGAIAPTQSADTGDRDHAAALAELREALLAVKPADLLPSERSLRGAGDAVGRAAREPVGPGSEPFVPEVSPQQFPPAEGVSTLLLRSEAVARLPERARAAATRMGIDLLQTPFPLAIQRVNGELARQWDSRMDVERSNVAMIGSAFCPSSDIPDIQAGRGTTVTPRLADLPRDRGSVKPVGVGDLLVVKQQIVGYEAGEVAYIENILKGETHSRTVTRSELQEESVLTERESVSEEERDLQSTERFELRRESEQTASMYGQLRSLSYGGLVEFDSNADTPLQGSLQLAQSQASTHGQEVTSRAVSRITQRVRTQVMRRTVRQFEERTRHAFENREGTGHVVGVYQWLDKVYASRVFNYGKRLLYDLVVPEPGAFLVQALANNHVEGRDLVKPKPFTLEWWEVHEFNYGRFARDYHATGLEPPPPLFQVVSETVDVPANTATKAAKVPVPAGYAAFNGYAIRTVLTATGPYFLHVTIGQTSYEDEIGGPHPLYWRFGLNFEVGSVPVAVKARHCGEFVVTVEIGCLRTIETYWRWQQRTHDLLRQAAARKQADYEERLANVEAAVRAGVVGLSPAEKRAIAREELKKSCLALLTRQHFDAFGAIDLVNQTDPVTGQTVPYAQVNVDNAPPQGIYIRFFEQAFEWDQIMFTPYSYFWARKDHWIRNVLREDVDAEFRDFLRCGAARVVVPARPGFEKAIMHFMETGQLWAGGEVPDVSDPLYVPLLTEIAERPAESRPYGDPWTLKLPTSLVSLRERNGLPTWTEKDGEWVPD